MNQIPEAYRDLLEDETQAYAFLATIMPDGSPQLTKVWFDHEGDLLRVNTREGRVKDRNMSSHPRVALAIADPDDHYRYIQVRGKVLERTVEGAKEHIERLSHKYIGKDFDQLYGPRPAGEVRVIYKIQPTSVSSIG
jgi:PPOX class probable F420-dependent enzyme